MQPDETTSPAVEPMLLRLRTGKTAALVIALGFGGGTIVLGVGTVAASGNFRAMLSAFLGYGLAVVPLLVLAGVIAVCKSELWLLPDKGTLRMLTYRPWRLSPRVEEAPLSEYAGVRTSKMADDYGNATLVSLVTTSGEDVPIRQFKKEDEAAEYAEKLGAATGFWVRAADESKAAAV